MLAFALIVVAFVFFVRYAPALSEAILESAKSTSNYEILSHVADEKELTARETEIVLLISQGYTSKTIAEMLYVSPETVRTHTKRIYRKLGIHNRQDIIKFVNSHSN
nr:LuxR C-terminal-related transcriptional regulator [Eggerthella hominis]